MKRHIVTKRHIGQAEAAVESESDTESLPDRLINPNQYEVLSHTAQQHRVAGPKETNEAVDEEPKRLITVGTYSSIK